MIELAEKNLCTGCGACAFVCPREAIDMRETEIGIVYPIIDEEKCISCKKCQKVCPILNPISYHKPQISLNHLWQIDHKSSLSTAVYASIGRGNGYSGTGTSEYRNKWYGASYGNLNWDFRHEDGTFNYDAIDELNANSTSGSKMVMAKAMNNHEWYGVLSTYTTKIGEYFDFYGGIDYRYYKGLHQNIITDLFSGKYYVDYNRGNVLPANNAAATNPDFVNQKLGVGDVIYRDYDGFVMSEGIFAQLEYNRDKLSAFVSGGASNTSYWRYDRFYYDEAHAKSSKKHYLGGNIKGGANYNLTENHNVFFNAGYISRAPMFDTSFINSQNSHERNPDAVNEKVMSFELGYGFRSKFFAANVNAYYTKWIDKSLYDSSTGTNGERYTLNMTGANAKHMGVEVDFEAKPTRWMSINGMFSWGDWRWLRGHWSCLLTGGRRSGLRSGMDSTRRPGGRGWQTW